MLANRANDRDDRAMRDVKLTRGIMKNANGSCLAEFGDTRVLCTATIEDRAPAWRKGSGKGWLTAEYAMLPAAGNKRTRRETNGRNGRSMEIERLIGRSLRNVCDLNAMGGEVTMTIDCDVLQGDGGTRTASVTGGFVALALACRKLVEEGYLGSTPIRHFVTGVSAGIVDEQALLDLQYSEDSRAQVDLNCVMNELGEIIELQGTGEGRAFTLTEQQELVRLCAKGNRELLKIQKEALGGAL